MYYTCIPTYVRTYILRTYVSLLLVEPHYLYVLRYISSWFVCSSCEVRCDDGIPVFSAGGQTTAFLYLISVCTEVHTVTGGKPVKCIHTALIRLPGDLLGVNNRMRLNSQLAPSLFRTWVIH